MSKEKLPGKVTAIAIMSIVSGAYSILTAMAVFFVFCLFFFISIPLMVLGIFNIIYGARLLNNQEPKPNQVLAILDICSVVFCNFIPMVLGIVNLVFYSDPEVQEFFDKKNSLT